MRVFAVSGSLRAASTNTAVLRAAAQLAPSGVELAFHAGCATLPVFDPDLDGDAPPAPVRRLRDDGGRAEAPPICSPEYARGVAGALENVLDRSVGSAESPDEPAAVINASQRSTHADASLRVILDSMSTRLVATASITLTLFGRGLDTDGIMDDPASSALLRTALTRPHDAVAAGKDA